MVRTLLLALAAALAAPGALAQGITADTPLRPVTRTVALTNARVVVAPGQVLDRATVLLRDGRILAVGPRVEIPADARRIEADSLTVYAAFLDAFGNAGVPKPEAPPNDAARGDRGDPPRERAGIVPDRDVRAAFDASDARIKQLREAGFAAAHVAPRDGLLSGEGAVVLLRDLGRFERTSDLFLTGPLSAVARIDEASGVYPGTPMAVLAALRSAVENARRHRAWTEAYDARPAQHARPRPDPIAEGLAPLLDGQRRFVFVADGWLDGFRALRASADMRLSPLLAGVPDVAPLLDRLVATRTSVIAPLALPDTLKSDTLDTDLVVPPVTPRGLSYVANRRTVAPGDVGAERAQMNTIRREAIRRHEASPAALAAASVPFAFGTFDAKPADIHAALRRMVKAGLSADDALAALTTGAARLLGVERTLGTVEPGKLANLVVTTGPLFADTTAIRYVLVEGEVYEMEARPRRRPGARAGAAAGAPGLAGTWDFVVTTPVGDQSGAFTFTGEPGAWRGEAGPDGTAPENIRVEGAAVSFTVTSAEFGVVRISGTLDGDTLAGTADVGPLGSFPLTATRRPDR